MIKISLAILTVYLLYYAGNIVYDLFLKKDKKSNEDETEEFSLSEISEEQGFVSSVGIEDVENLNTPKSFNKNPIQRDGINETTEERQDLERLRQLFESEQDLDESDFSKENLSETNSSEIETQPSSKEEQIQNELQEPEQEQESSEQEFSETTVEENPQTKEYVQPNQELSIQETPKSKDWKTMLNLSETLVQLVANHNGHKVYHSVM